MRGGSIFWNRVIVIQRQSRHTKVNNSSVGKDCSLGLALMVHYVTQTHQIKTNASWRKYMN